MKVSQLSPEARSSVGIELKPLPSAHNTVNRTEWLLARARSMSLGLRLVLAEVDEIGISLKKGWISPEQAWTDLVALERVPVHVASTFYSQEGGGE
jgi:hypothetical protein